MSLEAPYSRGTERRGFAKRVAHELRDAAIGIARVGVFGPLLFAGTAWENSNEEHSNPFFWLPESVRDFAEFGSDAWKGQMKYKHETYANRIGTAAMGIALGWGTRLGVALRRDRRIVTLPRKKIS